MDPVGVTSSSSFTWAKVISDADNLLTTLFDHLSDRIFFLDPVGNILFLNRAAREAQEGKAFLPTKGILFPSLWQDPTKSIVEESIRRASAELRAVVADLDRNGTPSRLALIPSVREGRIEGLVAVCRNEIDPHRIEKERQQLKEELKEEMEQRLQERTLVFRRVSDGLLQSLTLLRQTQEQLVQAEKMASLGRLVSGISHEISTPIGIGVTTMSYLVDETAEMIHRFQEGRISKTTLQGFLDAVKTGCGIVQTNLQRAHQMIESFKRISVDQTITEIRTITLRTYLEEILLSLSPKWKGTKHKVELLCPSDLTLSCDPGALMQIVTNLVMNSFLHGFEGITEGVITMEISGDEKEILFRYRDNGVGMPQEHLRYLYDPFFTTRRGAGGTGLGMHIVYNLVTQTLGGSIICDSAPRKGFTCMIRIPKTPMRSEEHGHESR